VVITVTTTDPALVTAIEPIDAAHLPELPPDAIAQ
jgi:hypothetical protein